MTQVNEVPAAAPAPNAALVDTLSTVRRNVALNRTKIVEQIGMQEQQLEVQRETLKQFDAMVAALDVAVSDPFHMQTIAGVLSANTRVAEAPLPYADSTGGDSEGSAEEATPVSSEAGAVGTDANGSPVANDSGDAP